MGIIPLTSARNLNNLSQILIKFYSDIKDLNSDNGLDRNISGTALLKGTLWADPFSHSLPSKHTGLVHS